MKEETEEAQGEMKKFGFKTIPGATLMLCRSDYSKYVGDLLDICFGRETLRQSVLKCNTDSTSKTNVLSESTINDIIARAAIIGAHRGKLLYLGMRNKYCTACAWAVRLNITPKQHKCFRNWSGNFTAMESDIVEGFCQRFKMYGIKFNRVIRDGDSNVYKMILDARPYNDLLVAKI
ncbi:hypothetical protein AVEN_233384-1 [Araneus ventricosus]|uniref:Mutator-like transposase domain-containing protein n=1 Tax=Araneus ventricosus TaxID=182803 RepID=A0A4Y2MGS8_ARAVE|nr:hypothetical protein AVEN_233384-1 [Araneus ventricosus]